MSIGERDFLAVVGLALYWPSISYSFMPDDLMAALGQNTAVWNLVDLAFEKSAFILIGAAAASVLLAPRRRLRLCSWILVAVGTALMLFALWFAMDADAKARDGLAWVLPAVQGAYVGLLIIAWAMALGAMNLRESLTVLALSFFLNFVIVFIAQEVLLAGGVSGFWIPLAGLPLISGVVWAAGSRNWSRDMEKSAEESHWPISLKAVATDPYMVTIIALALYLFASFLFSGLYYRAGEPFSTTLLSKVLAVAISLLLVGLAVVAERGLEGIVPWVVLTLSCVLASYGVAFLGSTFPDLCKQVVLPTRMLACFFAWAAAMLLVKRHGLNPARGFLVCFVPVIALEGVYQVMAEGLLAFVGSSLEPSLVMQLCALPAMAMLIVALVLIARDSYREDGAARGMLLENDSSPVRDGSVEGAQREIEPNDRCEEIGRLYRLTPREVDVLRLLAEGHSQKKIAELLVVSLSSSQTYTKSIYRKMGVHSRQEVIDAVREGRRFPDAPS